MTAAFLHRKSNGKQRGALLCSLSSEASNAPRSTKHFLSIACTA